MDTRLWIWGDLQHWLLGGLVSELVWQDGPGRRSGWECCYNVTLCRQAKRDGRGSNSDSKPAHNKMPSTITSNTIPRKWCNSSLRGRLLGEAFCGYSPCVGLAQGHADFSFGVPWGCETNLPLRLVLLLPTTAGMIELGSGHQKLCEHDQPPTSAGWVNLLPKVFGAKDHIKVDPTILNREMLDLE